jgi:hypothetical protein
MSQDLSNGINVTFQRASFTSVFTSIVSVPISPILALVNISVFLIRSCEGITLQGIICCRSLLVMLPRTLLSLLVKFVLGGVYSSFLHIIDQRV